MNKYNEVAVVHYDDMLENVVNTVKSAYEDEGFDPSSAEQVNAYKDVVRNAYSKELKITCEE